MRRLALAPALLLAGPARAGTTIAYAPETNLERLDAELLARAERSVDLAAYANLGSALSTVHQRFCGFGAILKTMQQKQIVTLHSFQ